MMVSGDVVKDEARLPIGFNDSQFVVIRKLGRDFDFLTTWIILFIIILIATTKIIGFWLT